MSSIRSNRCVVAADDFALSAAVDDGILALIDTGMVTATACLTTSPRWRRAALRLSNDVRAKADIGVHIDLTEFAPLVSSHAALALAGYARALDEQRLRAALLAQLARFEDALGSAPDYVDGHRHVHQLPVVRDALVELLVERYPGRTPWVRVSRSRAAGWRGRVITWLGSDGLSARCRAAGLATSSRLLGLYDFKEGAPCYRVRLSAWVEGAVDRDVLVCHPAARIDAADPNGCARHAEFEAMSSPWWRNYLATREIRLCRGVECAAH